MESFIESRKKICVVHDLAKKLRKYRENPLRLGHEDPIETSNTATSVPLVKLVILGQSGHRHLSNTLSRGSNSDM